LPYRTVMRSVAEPALRVPARAWDRLEIVTWSIVVLVTAMRLVAAWNVPLIGDEGYYWEWSRHLALGYGDHPPGVAYTIFAFSWLGQNPFAVRIGFIMCGVLATIWTAKSATRLAGGDRRAGAVAALALTVTPLASVAFGSASPDGPYLAAWAGSLYTAIRASNSQKRGDYVLLGVALGALLLTRVFAFAFAFGLVMYTLAPSRRRMWRDGLVWSFGIAAAMLAPFVSWNATHQWATFAFALVSRHEQEWKWFRPFVLHAVNAGAYSPGLWIGALACLVLYRNALIGWTAGPLIVLLTLLAAHERIEIHWMFGAYLSLCVALGVAYLKLPSRARVVWASAAVVPALILFPLIFVSAVAPGFVYEQFVRSGWTLRNTGAFEIFTVPSLAQDVRNMMEANKAMVVTDGYGLSSTLDFYGGVPPVVIGYNAQGQESKRWYDADAQPGKILFVDKEPLIPRIGHAEDKDGRPDFVRQLNLACAKVVIGPTLGYAFHDSSGHDVPVRPYFTTWCDPKPHALRILQWDARYATPAVSLQSPSPGATS
jgi:Dolichyl-phosphate-mannose-protein mannosyltransferase